MKFSFSRAKSKVSRKPMKFVDFFLLTRVSQMNSNLKWFPICEFQVDTKTKPERIPQISNNKPRGLIFVEKAFWWAYFRRDLISEGVLCFKMGLASETWGAYFWEGGRIFADGARGVGLIVGILRYSLVRNCFRSCQFFL